MFKIKKQQLHGFFSEGFQIIDSNFGVNDFPKKHFLIDESSLEFFRGRRGDFLLRISQGGSLQHGIFIGGKKELLCQHDFFEVG